MSPFNLNLGLGMDYKVESKNKRLTGTINLSPLAVNYRYVGRLPLGPSYGLKVGKHTLLDFGSQLTADLVFSTQWFSSGKISNSAGMPRIRAALKAPIPWL